MTAQRPRLIVVGGGFAGLWCVRALAGEAIDITLLDRSNHHLFQPLLYQVATGGLSAPAIAAPLRHILRRQRNVRVLMAEVVGIDATARRVRLADGQELDGDWLLVASGSTHAYFGNEHWAPHAHGLKTLDDAMRIRAQVLGAFEHAELSSDPAERAAWLNFVVVGAGPTGVELAGTLAEIARHTLRSEFRSIDPTRARVLLVEGGSRVLSAFEPAMSARAQRQLERLGVEVRTNAAVTAVAADHAIIAGERIATHTVLWAAGVAASPLGALLGAPLDRAGRVLVQPDLSLPGHPRIFVAGDLACLRDRERQIPGVAPAAKQMGTHVAAAIRAQLRKRRVPSFRYRDYGALATIGRMAAVIQMGRLRLSGLPAWWFWLAAHVFFLIGFRNRLVVLIDWAWAYWTHQRHARIMTR
ncbi:MAG: NAD(P)/FAD-dependent oxidoreductase [Xanthomonadales bacterium]|nr:NADH dehydrogenase-like protein [Xanthomonadales bacterium]MCC6594620.1 NAD(P)/FAD-dependent oxidoreductase [Xanthomonadales bacterium]MCE7930820.1 NAD(P)/FAD-dependent oxidoreductase [Xanthomonadales bacterium PRO6]